MHGWSHKEKQQCEWFCQEPKGAQQADLFIKQPPRRVHIVPRACRKAHIVSQILISDLFTLVRILRCWRRQQLWASWANASWGEETLASLNAYMLIETNQLLFWETNMPNTLSLSFHSRWITFGKQGVTQAQESNHQWMYKARIALPSLTVQLTGASSLAFWKM